MSEPKNESKKSTGSADLLQLRKSPEANSLLKSILHIYSGGAVCDTDTRGFPTPENRTPTEIVVDASEGFIPLWDSDVTLRWRFQNQALSVFQNAGQIATYVRNLFGEGVIAWGDAAPVQFSERHDAWDFEIVVLAEDKCSGNGCTLASAFFPDAGRHELRIYPRMFQQSLKEQKETLAHEIGHIFGLRHFFADVSETAWPSKIFGKHRKFSIMNYGHDSKMGRYDKSDLKDLYQLARSRELTEINGTPIRLVRPFSANRIPTHGLDLIAAKQF